MSRWAFRSDLVNHYTLLPATPRVLHVQESRSAVALRLARCSRVDLYRGVIDTSSFLD